MFDKKENLRKSDIVFGVILVAASSFFLYRSRTMPTDVIRERNINVFAFTDPALLPTVVCSILIVLGLLLILGALKEGARVNKADFFAIIAWCRSKQTQRMWVIIGILVVYIFILIGRLPYVAATFLFLVGLMFYFKASKWWKILVISALTTAAIALGFGEFMMIPLP
ncbi:MAG: tripartite tricarboxylate transporter TctB family protein [Treponema sp.]|nr:tripartite tricarboxylate transporter TctB family protein [Treponema sp.]